MSAAQQVETPHPVVGVALDICLRCTFADVLAPLDTAGVPGAVYHRHSIHPNAHTAVLPQRIHGPAAVPADLRPAAVLAGAGDLHDLHVMIRPV